MDLKTFSSLAAVLCSVRLAFPLFFFKPTLLGVGDLVEVVEGPFKTKNGEISKIKDGGQGCVLAPSKDGNGSNGLVFTPKNCFGLV